MTSPTGVSGFGGDVAYYIMVYDVEVSRVGKIHKYLKRYLSWVQNSVFEGELTESEILKVKKDIKKIIKEEEDSVLIFSVPSKNRLEKEHLGIEKNEPTNII